MTIEDRELSDQPSMALLPAPGGKTDLHIANLMSAQDRDGARTTLIRAARYIGVFIGPYNLVSLTVPDPRYANSGAIIPIQLPTFILKQHALCTSTRAAVSPLNGTDQALGRLTRTFESIRTTLMGADIHAGDLHSRLVHLAADAQRVAEDLCDPLLDHDHDHNHDSDTPLP